MAFTTLPAGGDSAPGIQILGLTRADIDDPQTRKDLHDLWIQHGVLVFRDVEGVDFHIALSEVFGKCAIHPTREAWVEGRNELINIRYNPDKDNIYDVGGEKRGGWLPWHSDLIYMAKINRGGILRAIEVPAEGGHTGFIDRISAYERLPEDLKSEIEGLNVIYKFDIGVEGSKFGNKWGAREIRFSDYHKAIMSRVDDYPRSIHPMVCTQEETGRKVLNVSPWFAVAIQGRENAAGDALLRRVIECLENEDHAYYHPWQAGDMVLWDNWRVLHRATGVPPHLLRWLQRTTIFGDYGLGALESEAAEGLVYVSV